MEIIEKCSKKVLGVHSQLDEIDDPSIKHRLTPFVVRFGFILYKTEQGVFEVIESVKCILRIPVPK